MHQEKEALRNCEERKDQVPAGSPVLIKTRSVNLYSTSIPDSFDLTWNK